MCDLSSVPMCDLSSVPICDLSSVVHVLLVKLCILMGRNMQYAAGTLWTE